MLRMMFDAKRQRMVHPDGTEHISEESGGEGENTLQQDQPNDSNLEPWAEFVKRVTHNMEAMMTRYHLEDWIVNHRRRKWRFAGRVARCTDSRWSNRLLTWIPFLAAGRGIGHPSARWDDCIVKLAGGDWTNHAHDEQLWNLLSEAYVYREEVVESIGS